MGYIKLSKEQELQLVEDYRNGMPVEQVRENMALKPENPLPIK